MRWLISSFDAFLCRRLKVFEFSTEGDCLIRLQITHAPHSLEFGSHTVLQGEPVLMIHLWNEHIPKLPPDGPTLGWAVRMHRMFIRSLHEVAHYMRSEPNRMAGIRAIGGITALFSPVARSGGKDIVHRLGFTVSARLLPTSRLKSFGENIYSWMLLWTYNPRSLRSHRFLHLLGQPRAEMWIPTGEFLRRYGNNDIRRHLLTLDK